MRPSGREDTESCLRRTLIEWRRSGAGSGGVAARAFAQPHREHRVVCAQRAVEQRDVQENQGAEPTSTASDQAEEKATNRRRGSGCGVGMGERKGRGRAAAHDKGDRLRLKGASSNKMVPSHCAASERTVGGWAREGTRGARRRTQMKIPESAMQQTDVAR